MPGIDLPPLVRWLTFESMSFSYSVGVLGRRALEPKTLNIVISLRHRTCCCGFAGGKILFFISCLADLHPSLSRGGHRRWLERLERLERASKTLGGMHVGL
jgi:hypothetical protein